jgi:hypothetical protein
MAPPFLILALEGSEWSSSRPYRLNPRKHPRYPSCNRLGGALLVVRFNYILHFRSHIGALGALGRHVDSGL